MEQGRGLGQDLQICARLGTIGRWVTRGVAVRPHLIRRAQRWVRHTNLLVVVMLSVGCSPELVVPTGSASKPPALSPSASATVPLVAPAIAPPLPANCVYVGQPTSSTSSPASIVWTIDCGARDQQDPRVVMDPIFQTSGWVDCGGLSLGTSRWAQADVQATVLPHAGSQVAEPIQIRVAPRSSDCSPRPSTLVLPPPIPTTCAFTGPPDSTQIQTLWRVSCGTSDALQAVGSAFDAAGWRNCRDGLWVVGEQEWRLFELSAVAGRPLGVTAGPKLSACP